MRRATPKAPSCRSLLASLFLALAVTGCHSAYGDALARGDEYAKAGLYDKAAAEYEAATKIDPSDPAAQIKLKEVRRKMSGERLAKGKSLMQRGEIAAGLTAIQQAAKLDPDSADAQKALTDANATAISKASELLDADEGKKAFELTSLVLKGSPNDPRAKDLDGRVRERLAEQSYTRAEGFVAKAKLGNALMEFAACVSYRPGYKDAKLRIGQVKLALEQELMFYVVLDKFVDTGSALGATMSADLLGQSFNDKLPLRVVSQLPQTAAAGAPPPPAAKGAKPPDPKAAEAAPSVHGVRISGKFDGYTFRHDSNKVGRTCDYVCGKDYVPNPAYSQAEQAVADSERQQAQADGEAARAQQDVDRYQKDVDQLQQEVNKAEMEAERARADLDRCEANKKPGDTSSCSSERSRYESERRDVESIRSRLSSPQSSLESARSHMTSARDRSNNARQSKERATEAMRTTPKQKEVERHCPHNYQVDVHTLTARVVVQLSAENLPDKTKLLDGESFEYKVDKRDETFEAQQGRCAQVASGDPLQLPNEKQVKQELVTQTIGGVRDKVMSTYERYRQRFLADARREEAAGLADEAVEAYVRYLLTGPKRLDPKDEKQIGEFLGKTRGFGKLDELGGL